LVVWLVGDTETRFLPDAAIAAVIVSPSTGQLPSPVTVTVTFPLVFLFSVSVVGDTANELASHTGVAVGVGIVEIVGACDGIAVGTAVGVAVGVLVGVTDVVTVGVGVGISVMVKLESWTVDEPS